VPKGLRFEIAKPDWFTNYENYDNISASFPVVAKWDNPLTRLIAEHALLLMQLKSKDLHLESKDIRSIEGKLGQVIDAAKRHLTYKALIGQEPSARTVEQTVQQVEKKHGIEWRETHTSGLAQQQLDTQRQHMRDLLPVSYDALEKRWESPDFSMPAHQYLKDKQMRNVEELFTMKVSRISSNYATQYRDVGKIFRGNLFISAEAASPAIKPISFFSEGMRLANWVLFYRDETEKLQALIVTTDQALQLTKFIKADDLTRCTLYTGVAFQPLCASQDFTAITDDEMKIFEAHLLLFNGNERQFISRIPKFENFLFQDLHVEPPPTPVFGFVAYAQESWETIVRVRPQTVPDGVTLLDLDSLKSSIQSEFLQALALLLALRSHSDAPPPIKPAVQQQMKKSDFQFSNTP
jgi:hypothetical protein